MKSKKTDPQITQIAQISNPIKPPYVYPGTGDVCLFLLRSEIGPLRLARIVEEKLIAVEIIND